jgi:hypothetical protein
MTMKVVFEKETYRLLGAQIIGYDGVDKRIDVLAAALHARMRACDLKELDLAYAPPYSAAKDPVNMAGFMIDNIARGIVKQFHLQTSPRCQGRQRHAFRHPHAAEFARGLSMDFQHSRR